MKKIHKQAVKMGWNLEIKADQDLNGKVAILSEDHPIPEIKRITARGGTNLYGILMRIGNTKPSARIKVSEKTAISVDMTKQMVKDLESKHKLYDVVGFEGTATWSVDNWKMVEFQATRIIGYHADGGDLGSMLGRLTESADGRWDGVDAVKFVNKLRGR